MANLTGLDLGSRSFKGVALAKAKTGYSLLSLAYQDLPFPEEDVSKEDLLAENLKRFMKESGLRMRDVALSIPGESASLKVAEMAKMTPEELRKILPYEIEQHLPITPEEYVIDFQVLGTAASDATKMNVLLAGGRLEVAEALYKAATQAKLNCVAVDVDDLALVNMFEVNYAWEEDYQKVVCLLNVGNRITSVIIFDGGQYRFSRPVTIAGETLTKDIQRDFSLKAEQAEDLKREQGKVVVEASGSFSLSMFDTADRTLRVAEAFSGSLNKLVTQVKLCHDYYETQFKGRTVEKILLAGGGASLKNLDRFLADKLSVPVEFADPFRQIKVPARPAVSALIEAHGAAFGVGVGLALRRFG